MYIPEDIRQQSLLYYLVHIYYVVYYVCIKFIQISSYFMYVLHQMIINISNHNYAVWDDFQY